MWLQSIPQQFMYANKIAVLTLERNLPMMAFLVRVVGPT